MNKKILFLILLAVVAILPLVTSAQPTIGSMADAIRDELVAVGWACVVIGWVITAILFLISPADPSKLGAAKVALLASIAGTIVMILAPNAIAFVKNSFRI